MWALHSSRDPLPKEKYFQLHIYKEFSGKDKGVQRNVADVAAARIKLGEIANILNFK